VCRIIDNLPAASITVDDLYQTTYYSRGFLVGTKVSRLHMLKISSTYVYISEYTVLNRSATRRLCLIADVNSPCGATMQDDKDRYVLHNHVRIFLDYHQIADSKEARVVGFRVRPFSVDHKFKGKDMPGVP
jgi:hypothetical protein